MSNFRVGQKVVCVDAKPSFSRVPAPFKEGDVLTVSAITTGWSGHGLDTGLCFEEVPCVGQCYNGYSARRFRPVVERKTDISIFRAMLNTTPETVGAV